MLVLSLNNGRLILWAILTTNPSLLRNSNTMNKIHCGCNQENAVHGHRPTRIQEMEGSMMMERHWGSVAGPMKEWVDEMRMRRQVALIYPKGRTFRSLEKNFINFGVVKWASRISYHEWQNWKIKTNQPRKHIHVQPFYFLFWCHKGSGENKNSYCLK